MTAILYKHSWQLGNVRLYPEVGMGTATSITGWQDPHQTSVKRHEPCLEHSCRTFILQCYKKQNKNKQTKTTSLGFNPHLSLSHVCQSADIILLAAILKES